MTSDPVNISFRTWEAVEKKAFELGFDAVGVAPVESLPGERTYLQRWLEAGKQGNMHYMERNADKRENPALLVEGARSVIVTLTNYYTSCRQSSGLPLIARYAYGEDYHTVIKRKLRELMEGMGGRCFTDSAPVFEREWARRAGLGWIGKNTLLIRRNLGSFCFIGLIITPTVFDRYSVPLENRYCGTCERCIKACPTGALTPYQLDARKCISYQTIENKEECPEAIKRLSGGRIFGCDICQEACSWNKRSPQHQVKEFFPKEEVMRLTRESWEQMSETDFLQLFKGTPLERTGLTKIRSNLKET